MRAPKKLTHATESQLDDTRLVAGSVSSSQSRKESDESSEKHDSRIEMISARHELDILKMDSSIKLANLTLKQTQSINGADIRFMGQLISGPWRRMVAAEQNRLSELTEARVECMKVVASAIIELMYSEQLAMADCMKQTASALCQYYRAIIMDRLAKMMLFRIARTLQIEPDFRFKLERPLRVSVEKYPLVRRKRAGPKMYPQTKRLID